jgi:hypothetical protein
MTKSHEIDWPPQDECARFEKTLEFVARWEPTWVGSFFVPEEMKTTLTSWRSSSRTILLLPLTGFRFFLMSPLFRCFFRRRFFSFFSRNNLLVKSFNPRRLFLDAFETRSWIRSSILFSSQHRPKNSTRDIWKSEKKTTMSRSRPSRDAKRPIPNLNRPLCAYQGFKQGVARCFIKTHLNMPHVNRRWVITCNNKTVASTAKSTCKGVIERNADGGKLKVPPPGGHLERVVFRS